MAAKTIKRIGFWMLGRMLPQQRVFEYHVRHMARGVMYLVCGGVILAAIALSMLGVAYAVMVEHGLSALMAGAITTSIAVAGAVICFMVADRSLQKASALTEELKMDAPSLPSIEAELNLQEGATLLLNAFLNGLTGAKSSPVRQRDLFEDDEEDAGDDYRSYKEQRENIRTRDDGTLYQGYGVHIREKKAGDHRGHDKDIIHFRPRRHG